MSEFSPVRPAGDRLRVGLIGAGATSQFHLIAWRKLPGVEVVAACDIDVSRARERAEAFEIPAVYAGAEEMLLHERLDAVDIAAWTETHVGLTQLAAANGAHVLCQKPLAPTLAEAEALAAGVAGRIRLMVHENRRFAPYFRAIRGWIDEGRVGALRQCVLTTFRSSLIKGPDERSLSAERAAYFARHARDTRLLIGSTLNHQLDVMQFLLGPLAMVAARTLHTEPDLPGETLATLLLETPEGAPVVVAGSGVAPGYGRGWADHLEIIGAKSSVVLDGSSLEVRGEHSERLTVDYKAAYQVCFDVAIAHFVECLLSGAPFETAPEDNLQTLRLVEDAYALAAGPRRGGR